MKVIGQIPSPLQGRLENPQSLLASNDAEIISIASYDKNKNSLKDNLANFNNCKRVVLKYSTANKQFLIKYFFPKTLPRRSFYKYCKNDPLMNSYYIEKALSSKSNIKTAHSYCWAREQNYAFSFVVQQFLTDEIVISECFRKLLEESNESAQMKLKIAHWLAIELSSMHNQGFYHRDIKPSHLFVRKEFQDLVWIDLDRAHFNPKKQISISARVNNLYHVIRYLIFPIDWSLLSAFIYSYHANSRTEQLPSPDVLLHKVLEFYQFQTQKTVLKQKKIELSGLLTEEDFSISNSQSSR